MQITNICININMVIIKEVLTIIILFFTSILFLEISTINDNRKDNP